MKAFRTSIDIKATPERIWSLLTDATAYPRWNRTVDKVDGEIRPGAKIKVFAKATPGRAFPVRVVTFEPARRMVWAGGMPLGLFRGERTFTLAPANGTTTFTMAESFSGLMAPLITKSIPDLQPAFDEFAACLRTAAESRT